MSDDSLNLEAFETTVSDLGKRVYSDDVKNEVTKLLAALPSPDDVKGDVAKKVRLLTLRAKARLLLPAYNKDAEADLAKALKLKPTDTNAWVAMSECHWKRSAVKEARDALHSALSIDANHIGALVQLSRVLRSLCSQANTTAEEQAVLLEESVSKAKAAVALDPNAGEAWSALGIALMQQTVSTGMNLLLLRKALQALTQAARKAEYDPDVHYNRGVVFRCLGEYGNAHACFKRAFELDPKGLAGAAKDAERCAGIVTGFKGILHTFATDEDRQRDLKKNVTSKIPIAEKPNGSHSGRDYNVLSQLLRPAVCDAGRWGCVKVLDMISSRSEQPLCFVAADREGTIAAVLVYRVLPSAIKTGDTLFLGVPPCAVAVVEHSLPGEPGSEPTTLRLTTVTVDPAALFVNGAPIGAGQYKMPMLATRQFA